MCEQDTSRFFDLGKVYCHTHTLLPTGTSIYQRFSFKIVEGRGFLMVVATITGTKLGPQTYMPFKIQLPHSSDQRQSFQVTGSLNV